MRLAAITFAFISALLLPGCGVFPKVEESITPESLSTRGPVECAYAVNNYASARNCTETTIKEYRDRQTALIKNRTFLFDLPLIGTALAAAGTVFFGAHPDTIFGVGLMGAGIGAMKTYANPTFKAKRYFWGQQACLCTLDIVSWFILKNSPSLGSPGPLEGSIGANIAQVDLHQQIIAALVVEIGKQPRDGNVTSVLESLELARSSGETARAVGSEALTALTEVPATVRKTLISIDTKIQGDILENETSVGEIIKSINSELDTVKASMQKTQDVGAENRSAELVISQVSAAMPLSSTASPRDIQTLGFDASAMPAPPQDLLPLAKAVVARMKGVTEQLTATATEILNKKAGVIACTAVTK